MIYYVSTVLRQFSILLVSFKHRTLVFLAFDAFVETFNRHTMINISFSSSSIIFELLVPPFKRPSLILSIFNRFFAYGLAFSILEDRLISPRNKGTCRMFQSRCPRSYAETKLKFLMCQAVHNEDRFP